MTNWHVAQINIATALFPLDDDRLADFMNQLDVINALADDAAGFVWRLQSDSGNATDITVGGDEKTIVNMSVWESVAALQAFAYDSAHRAVMIRRRDWFQPPGGAYQALWWIAAGQVPDVGEGMARLEKIRAIGPSAEAFTFKTKFPAPED